jgi:C_GCAxxG_C_C family probable redox protein
MPELMPPVSDEAARLFTSGFNCAQSVLKAVSEARGMSCPGCIPGVALALGGGVAHTSQICGAITGGVMAVGLAVDRTSKGGQVEKKQEANRQAAHLVHAFEAEFGAQDCSALLGFSWDEPDAMDRFKRESFGMKRCTPFVRWAAEEADRICRGIMNK